MAAPLDDLLPLLPRETVFVVHAGVIAGSAPGTLAALSEQGVVFMVSGAIDRERLRGLFGHGVDVYFDWPARLERRGIDGHE